MPPSDARLRRLDRKLHFSAGGVAWRGFWSLDLLWGSEQAGVLLQWAYSYFAYKRSARIITSLPENIVSYRSRSN